MKDKLKKYIKESIDILKDVASKLLNTEREAKN
jgi:hypothetical protein